MIGVMIMSYVIGSIPNGLIIGRWLYGVDLREVGSGNIGATNGWREIGKSAGVLIFLLDFLKGAMAEEVAQMMIGTAEAQAWAGFLAMLGHTKSIFMRFSGGKGVATGLGAAMEMMPEAAIGAILVWALIVKTTKYVSLGSVIGVLTLIVLVKVLEYPQAYEIFSLLAGVSVVIRHRSNLKRLMKGRENKVRW